MSGPPITLLRLASHGDGRGNLVAIQAGDGALPFEIRRVYYIYGVPEGQARGMHSHRQLTQLMIAVSGRVDVVLDNGQGRSHVTLDDPAVGLLIQPMTWREMTYFAPGSVCLVLASLPYDESDYIRDYKEFCVANHNCGG